MLGSKAKRELKRNQRRILIDSIEIGIPSPEQILTWGARQLPNGQKVGEIKNSKTVNYKRFTPLRDGLFCERIFGPINSYTCACGKRQPRSDIIFCDKCQVEYTDQRARRSRLGYISLVSPVAHIWYLKGRPSYLSLFLGKRKKKVVALAYCNAYLVEQVSRLPQPKAVVAAAVAQPTTAFGCRKAVIDCDKFESAFSTEEVNKYGAGNVISFMEKRESHGINKYLKKINSLSSMKEIFNSFDNSNKINSRKQHEKRKNINSPISFSSLLGEIFGRVDKSIVLTDAKQNQNSNQSYYNSLTSIATKKLLTRSQKNKEVDLFYLPRLWGYTYSEQNCHNISKYNNLLNVAKTNFKSYKNNSISIGLSALQACLHLGSSKFSVFFKTDYLEKTQHSKSQVYFPEVVWNGENKKQKRLQRFSTGCEPAPQAYMPCLPSGSRSEGGEPAQWAGSHPLWGCQPLSVQGGRARPLKGSKVMEFYTRFSQSVTTPYWHTPSCKDLRSALCETSVNWDNRHQSFKYNGNKSTEKNVSLTNSLLELHQTVQTPHKDLNIYNRSQTFPFLPNLICKYNLRDELLNFLSSLPLPKDKPIFLYCHLKRQQPIRDVHQFMSEQVVENFNQKYLSTVIPSQLTPRNTKYVYRNYALKLWSRGSSVRLSAFWTCMPCVHGGHASLSPKSDYVSQIHGFKSDLENLFPKDQNLDLPVLETDITSRTGYTTNQSREKRIPRAQIAWMLASLVGLHAMQTFRFAPPSCGQTRRVGKGEGLTYPRAWLRVRGVGFNSVKSRSANVRSKLNKKYTILEQLVSLRHVLYIAILEKSLAFQIKDLSERKSQILTLVTCLSREIIIRDSIHLSRLNRLSKPCLSTLQAGARSKGVQASRACKRNVVQGGFQLKYCGLDPQPKDTQQLRFGCNIAAVDRSKLVRARVLARRVGLTSTIRQLKYSKKISPFTMGLKEKGCLPSQMRLLKSQQISASIGLFNILQLESLKKSYRFLLFDKTWLRSFVLDKHFFKKQGYMRFTLNKSLNSIALSQNPATNQSPFNNNNKTYPTTLLISALNSKWMSNRSYNSHSTWVKPQNNRHLWVPRSYMYAPKALTCMPFEHASKSLWGCKEVQLSFWLAHIFHQEIYNKNRLKISSLRAEKSWRFPNKAILRHKKQLIKGKTKIEQSSFAMFKNGHSWNNGTKKDVLRHEKRLINRVYSLTFFLIHNRLLREMFSVSNHRQLQTVTLFKPDRKQVTKFDLEKNKIPQSVQIDVEPLQTGNIYFNEALSFFLIPPFSKKVQSPKQGLHATGRLYTNPGNFLRKVSGIGVQIQLESGYSQLFKTQQVNEQLSTFHHHIHTNTDSEITEIGYTSLRHPRSGFYTETRVSRLRDMSPSASSSDKPTSLVGVTDPPKGHGMLAQRSYASPQLDTKKRVETRFQQQKKKEPLLSQSNKSSHTQKDVLSPLEHTTICEILSYTGGGALHQLLQRFDTQLFSTFLFDDVQKTREIYKKRLINNGYPPNRVEKRALTRLCRRIYKNSRRLKIAELFTRSKRRPEWMMISVLPVLPPDLRPILQMSESVVVASDLNNLYQRVIYRNNRFHKLSFIDFHLVTAIQRLVQDAVDRLIENGKGGSKPFYTPSGRPLQSLSDTLKGKKGRFRLNLLGKRVDFSGRSVIVVAPNLKIHECGLPREIALELYHYFLLREFMLKRQASSIVMAKKRIKQKEPFMWDALRNIIYHHPVLLNRAPTLHRLGIQAFQPKLVKGNAILLNPLVCSGFNADFDGDQMGVHLPLSVQARAEAWDLLWARNNLLSPATGQPVLVPSQDMVLGFYYMTQTVSSRSLICLDKRREEHLYLSWKNQRAASIGSAQKNSALSLNNNCKNVVKHRVFFNCLNVIQAFQNQHIQLHTPVWLQWKEEIENDESSQIPIELRINSFAGSTYIYSTYKLRKHENTFKFNLYIRTTAGRVLVNSVFLL